MGIEDDAFLTGQDSTILDLSGDKVKILRQGVITQEDILAKIPAIPFEEV
ncbi:Sua5/YciO/YrdC family protein [Streptococcus infantis SK1302]|uniref:Sua5/YciO/YrdC family protein n=1 Tax=Streptococcus infantis SK1302 TaxID=871237 RepID=A0ABP2J7A1_9STRE|nr:Sua5/YciO/YrdC family protein [Streptococcus infantis SK1302]